MAHFSPNGCSGAERIRYAVELLDTNSLRVTSKKNRRGRSESAGLAKSQLAYPLSCVVAALSGEAPLRWWTFVANCFLLALAVALVLGVAEVRSNYLPMLSISQFSFAGDPAGKDKWLVIRLHPVLVQ